jgi:hypothetical protein
MQKTIMIDPITQGQDLQKNNSTCLYNFNFFIGEIQMLYGDKDWRLNVATNSFHDIRQGYCNANENVRADTNQL